MTDTRHVGPGVDIQGIGDVERRLDLLPAKLQKKLVRKTLRKAAKPLLEKARANAPISTEGPRQQRGEKHKPGTLRKSIKIRSAGRSRRHPDRIAVTVSTGAKDNLYKGETFYGAFVELGTANQPPQGFLSRAANEAGPAVLAVFNTETGAALDEAIRELAGAISSGNRSG